MEKLHKDMIMATIGGVIVTTWGITPWHNKLVDVGAGIVVSHPVSTWSMMVTISSIVIITFTILFIYTMGVKVE